MTGEQMLHHVAGILADRGTAYGDAATSMAAVAARWSITLGRPVTPVQVVLCLIDLKLTRLQRNPEHRDLLQDGGIAREITRMSSATAGVSRDCSPSRSMTIGSPGPSASS
jgi:hypothetical protein